MFDSKKKKCVCSERYLKCLEVVEVYLHGPDRDVLQLLKKGRLFEEGVPSSLTKLVFINESLNSLSAKMVDYLYDFIADVKRSVVLKLIVNNISCDEFQELLHRMSCGSMKYDLDYGKIINQCAFIIDQLPTKIFEAVDIFFQYIECGMLDIMDSNEIRVLCCGPNIEGNIFMNLMSIIKNKVVSVIGYDIEKWEYDFDKTSRITKKVEADDVGKVNLMFHGMKYLSWMNYKTSQDMINFLGDRIIISLEHKSVARGGFDTFYAFGNNSQHVTKGIICKWSFFYVFKALKARAFVKIGCCVYSNVRPCIAPRPLQYDSICFCVTKDHYCHPDSVLHDIIIMQEAVIEKCSYSDLASNYKMIHSDPVWTKHVGIDSTADYNRIYTQCPLRCAWLDNHKNYAYLSRGLLYKHLKCVEIYEEFKNDEEIYNCIKEILH